VLSLRMLREPLDAVHVNGLVVLSGDPSRCVVRVLHFHADVRCLVHCNPGCCFFTRANRHIQVERSVSFVLAVLDAGLFSRGLGTEGVAVDAVKVAAAE